MIIRNYLYNCNFTVYYIYHTFIVRVVHCGVLFRVLTKYITISHSAIRDVSDVGDTVKRRSAMHRLTGHTLAPPKSARTGGNRQAKKADQLL